MPDLRGRLAIVIICGVLAVAGCAHRPARTAAQSTGPAVEYVVQTGDTLSSVAAAYGISVDELIASNHLRRRTLSPGTVILVPGFEAAPEAPPVATPRAPSPLPAVPISDHSWYVPRNAWTDQNVDLSNVDAMVHPVYRITVHHTGEYGDASAETKPMLRLIEKVHMRDRGWACIGYHFIIARDGTVYEGRPLKYQGAHAGGDNNIGNIGISLLGDFDRSRVPETQSRALGTVLTRLCAEYGITRGHIYGHRFFKITECPGRYLMAWLDEWKQSK